MSDRVFLSWSSNDLEAAQQIRDLLEARGIACWMAPRDIPPGSIYPEEIIKAIKGACAFVLIFSRHCNGSAHVRNEVELAFSSGRQIFPVLLEDAPLGEALEYFLTSTQRLNAWSEPIEKTIEALAQSIKKALGGERSEEARETRRTSKKRNNLPSQLTPFIGGEKEVDDVRRLLQNEHVRLITLTGPGGAGKTRLSLQAAGGLLQAFEDGVFFVPLDISTNPDAVPELIMQTLSVRESEGTSTIERLKDYLEERRALIILDNFEQVVSAAPVVSDLLVSCPRLTVLVTSRENLRVRGEHICAVPALDLPPPITGLSEKDILAAGLTQYDATRLFIDRAAAANPNLEITDENAPAIAQICRRMDGLPLGIELAAAWTKMLPPQKIIERLEKRLPTSDRGLRDQPARQQTLHAAIEWSHDLLADEERIVFRRLSVFAGGWSLEAAEGVCGLGAELDVVSIMASLADKSLVKQAQTESERRFSMLQTIRDYARECLGASGEEDVLRRSHAAHFLAKAELLLPEGWKNAEGVKWERTERENLRDALEWCFGPGDDEIGCMLTAMLTSVWEGSAGMVQGKKWIETAVSKSAEMPNVLRGTILREAAYYLQTNMEVTWLNESLELHRSAGDDDGYAKSLWNIAAVAVRNGDYTRAMNLLAECKKLFQSLGDQGWLGHTFHIEARMLRLQTDIRAAEVHKKGLETYRSAGHDWGEVISLCALGELSLATEDLEESMRYFEESISVAERIDRTDTLFEANNSLGRIELLGGNVESAKSLFKKAFDLAPELGDEDHLLDCLTSCVLLARATGQPHSAVVLSAVIDTMKKNLLRAERPDEEAEYRQCVAASRDILGDDAFLRAKEEGQGMTKKSAINYAVGLVG